MPLKLFLYTLLFVCCCASWATAQDSVVPIPKPKQWIKKVVKRKDTLHTSVQPVAADSVVQLRKHKMDTAKTNDTALAMAVMVDTLHNTKDSLSNIQPQKQPVLTSSMNDTSTYASVLPIPYLPFGKNPTYHIVQEHKSQSQNELFYTILFTMALLGFIRVAFPRYLTVLFAQFFQTAWRKKTIRDQSVQQSLPSLLANLLFIISGGVYAALIVAQKQWIQQPFWQLLLYCTMLLVAVYAGKFLFIVFSGWAFNIREAANQYIFIVYLGNKMLGIFLLPFIAVVAFSGGNIATIATTISIALLMGILCYRYFISLGAMSNSLKINPLHFFLYLCTIEVLPLLLIYKAFFNYIA